MVMLLLVLVVTARGKYGSNGGCCGRGCCLCKVPLCHDCGCSNSVAAVVFVVSMIGQVVIVVFVTVLVVFVALVVALIAVLAVVDFLLVFGAGGPEICVIASQLL